ncbi:hypothetical protein ACFV0B_24455 [Streptomyces xanthophaeus]|uniref:hypothetical protein n=1 Tax=Streptomyces xanthophaeus TaxID=67385 RepID=UPI0036C36123
MTNAFVWIVLIASLRVGAGADRASTANIGDFSGTGLTWRELIRIADSPSFPDDGVHDTAIRLLLLLPLLTDPDVPETAMARIAAALAGAPRVTASIAAEHLLAHLTKRSRRDPSWASPLSGS